jgi:hypothetical protein
MPVVGQSPSEGHRLELRREAVGVAPPWRYEGTLARPEGEALPVVAFLAAEGTVSFEPACTLEAAQRERVERTLRMALRAARQEDPDALPPRRLTRWRGEDGR